MTTAADLRTAADRIEHLAPAWAARMRREADRMETAAAMDQAAAVVGRAKTGEKR